LVKRWLHPFLRCWPRSVEAAVVGVEVTAAEEMAVAVAEVVAVAVEMEVEVVDAEAEVAADWEATAVAGMAAAEMAEVEMAEVETEEVETAGAETAEAEMAGVEAEAEAAAAVEETAGVDREAKVREAVALMLRWTRCNHPHSILWMPRNCPCFGIPLPHPLELLKPEQSKIHPRPLRCKEIDSKRIWNWHYSLYS